MPHKVSFNIEVFDKLARTVIVGKDGNRPVLDVEYENTKGQLRKGLKDNKDVSDNWAENQPAGPNRHFLWNKISIIKNDKDGTFSIGPEITGPYETPTADGPTYLFGPSSVAAQKIYSDKLYSCSGTTEGIKTAPLTTSIYFLAGMNNGYYRHSKLTGSYPSNYLTDLDKTNCFSKAVFGNWTNYKKITDSYLNLVKNRLAEKKDGSFKVLQADCNPLIRPLITPTPLDNDNPVKRKFANDPDNCHFFPSDSYDPGAFKKVCKDMKEDKAKTRSLWHNADSKVKPDPQKFYADKLLFVSLDSSKDVKCQSDYKLGMDGDKKTQNIDTGAIIKHCVVPSNVDLVAGFYVCDHMTIKSRSSRLDMVGTFIVGSLTIESGAYSAGIHWHSAFSTVGTKLL
ncbi:MAG: hypothetical protein J6Y94_08435, partial [Bacteriovoracaceae bacterium]|nr:hypothetical protein [Bacteriovoracaceae bacterium]